MSRTITVEHNGQEYSGQIARIKSTHLGYEDHGILTAFLHTEWPGGGVGVGGYGLDSYDESKGRRIATAYGLDQIVRIMETVGVSSWEELPGKQVIVLFPGGQALDDKKVLILKEHATEWLGES